MRTLMIVDSNEDFCLALTQALCAHYQIRCCGNGQQALELLRREPADLLILDVMLAELDGITLLERMQKEGLCPKVLLATSLLTDYVYTSAQRLNIGYIVRKPCDMDALAARALDFGSTVTPPPQKPDPRHLSQEYLLRLGFLVNHDGFRFLHAALPMQVAQPDLQITKAIYPVVAKQYGKVPRHVERSIRSSIESAWKNGDQELWQKYFPGLKKRPSNAVFLSKIAALIRRDLE